jgi:hypothetical protein
MILKISFHRLVGQIAHKKTVLVVHNMRAASNTAAGALPGQTSDGERNLKSSGPANRHHDADTAC